MTGGKKSADLENNFLVDLIQSSEISRNVMKIVIKRMRHAMVGDKINL